MTTVAQTVSARRSGDLFLTRQMRCLKTLIQDQRENFLSRSVSLRSITYSQNERRVSEVAQAQLSIPIGPLWTRLLS